MFHVKHCPFYFYLLSRHCELLQHGFLDGEVHGDAATHHQIQFALDQRQEIGHCLVADVIACRGEELSGQELFPVGDLGASAGSITTV